MFPFFLSLSLIFDPFFMSGLIHSQPKWWSRGEVKKREVEPNESEVKNGAEVSQTTVLANEETPGGDNSEKPHLFQEGGWGLL